MVVDASGTGLEVPEPVRLCCYLESTGMGGMEASLSTLLGHLDDRYEVTLLGVDLAILTAVAETRPGTRLRLVPPVKGKADVRAIAAHVRAVRDLRPDVLMASMGHLYRAPYAILAGLLNRVPTVAVAHSIMPPAYPFQEVLFRRLFCHLRGLAGVSAWVCEGAERALGLPPGMVTELVNGVPNTNWRGPSASIDLGAALHTPTVGAVGRLAPEKGYDVLIRAMTELPGCCLVLLGEGPERARLTKLARQLGVEDRVELAGWIPSPWTDHFRFDVIAVPSSFEGFGLVAVEALLAGIPVVASRVGGLAEIVHDGETGLLVEPGDPSALAHALRELLIDPARRDVMGRRGRDDALQRFTPAAMASAYEAFLSSAISGHSRHPLSRR